MTHPGRRFEFLRALEVVEHSLNVFKANHRLKSNWAGQFIVDKERVKSWSFWQ
jgi:hypothetical protein